MNIVPLLLISAFLFTARTATLEPSSNIINQVVTYTLTISDLNFMPINSVVIVKFPTQFSDQKLHVGQTYTWQNGAGDFCPVDCTPVTIQYQGYQFSLSGMFPSEEPAFLTFTFGMITNPSAALTSDDFTVEIQNPSGGTELTETISGITFQPETITCSGVISEDTEINAIGSLYIEMSPVTNSNAHPMSSIKINFPSEWSGQNQIENTLTSGVFCTSTSQTFISCNELSNTLRVSNVNYSPSIDIEVHSLYNPSSVMSAGVISIQTFDSSGNELDTCSFSATGYTESLLRLTSAEVTYVSSTLISLSIFLKFPSNVLSDDIIIVEIPSTFTLTGAIFSVKIGGVTQGSAAITYTSSNNSLEVDTFLFKRGQPEVEIVSQFFARPRLATTTSNFSIKTYRSNNLMTLFTCCSIILQPRQSLSMQSIIVTDPYLLASSTSYTFQFSISQSLLTTDYIIVQFPYQYTLTTVTCSLTAPTSSTPGCAVSGQQVKVTSLIAGTVNSGVTFSLTLSNIDNPLNNPSGTAFTVSVLSSDDKIVERNSAIFVHLDPPVIQSYTITSTNYTVYNKPTKLTFTASTDSTFSPSHSIHLTIPSSIAILTNHLQCTINSVVHPCSFNSPTVTIRSEATIASINDFSVDGVVNGRSLQAVSGFSFKFIDGVNNTIQESNSTFIGTYVLTNTGEFEQMVAHLPFPYNQNAELTLLLRVPFTINSEYLQVTFNSSQIKFDGSSCSPLSCSVTNSLLTITNLPQSNLLNISITPVIAYLPNITLSFQLKSSTHYSSLRGQTTVTEIYPDNIEYSLEQSSWIMGETSTITLSYSLSSTGQANISSVIVQVPPQYTTSAPSNKFNVTTLNGTIKIDNAVNPLQNYSSPFFLTAYSSNDEIIAMSSSNVYFLLICELPCRTCAQGNPSSCTSCYHWLDFNLFISENGGKCIDHCPQKYYLQTNTSQCLGCDSNCLTCDYFHPDVCQTCPTNEYLLNNTCYDTCPDSYFHSTTQFKVCLSCPQNCLICTNETHCTSCHSSYFFYQNLCLTSCPIKTYVLGQLCVDCADSNCLHCNSTGCIACEEPFYLHSQQCLANCPFSFLPNLQGTCSVCECLTCSVYSYNCTSCAANLNLFENKCYSSCPDGMYSLSNVCSACPSPCKRCSSASVCQICEEGYYLQENQCVVNCSETTIVTISSLNVSSCIPCVQPCLTCSISTTFCLTCVQSYSFHNNTCVLSCPSPYHSINFYCVQCIQTCLTCQTSDPYNCTQCQPSYYLYNTTCFSTCPSGTFTNIQPKKCSPCLSLCETCLNGTSCTSCKDGYFLFQWVCYTSCPTVPVYYYDYQGHCTACQPQCNGCRDSPVQCIECKNSSYYFNSITFQCGFTCSDPYFLSGSECILCQSPCLTCDTTYSSCSSCSADLNLFNGTCISECPSKYYASSTTNGSVCVQCEFPCSTCIQGRCTSCQNFAFMVYSTCVLACPSEMPFERSGFCSNCVSVSFCAICGEDDKGQPICTNCTYPYVLFSDTCLNQCPTNYTVNDSSGVRKCVQSPTYILYLQQLQLYNRPPFPMLFLILFIVLGVLFYFITNKLYLYTYHIGYLLSLLVALDTISIYYSLYYVFTRYTGEYINSNPYLPVYLLCAALFCNSILITFIYGIWVLRTIYLKDVRYHQWKQNHKCYWWVFVLVLMPVLGGHRLHKWNYSKIFNWDTSAFRIVSVQKFFQEDILTLCSVVGDLLYVVGMVICAYNIHIAYNAIFLLAYECLAMKTILWVLVLFDLKKPDRGFFKGDEEQAEEEIRQEEIDEENRIHKKEIEHLTKMIRTKSAKQLEHPDYFGKIDIDDFISVYDPTDYQDVPHVPKKKIQKNLYKGKFRKGKKITLEEKLKKYIDKIQPRKPQKKKVTTYLNNWLYWKPPEFVKVKEKKIPQSEQSMLELLNRKEQEYKDDFEQGEEKKEYYMKKRYNQRNYLDDIDETIPNDTIDFFYPSSIEYEKETGYGDLMNLNYAQKRHLPKKQIPKMREESLRVLHHEPKKKRQSNLPGFGNMVLKKFD